MRNLHILDRRDSCFCSYSLLLLCARRQTLSQRRAAGSTDSSGHNKLDYMCLVWGLRTSVCHLVASPTNLPAPACTTAVHCFTPPCSCLCCPAVLTMRAPLLLQRPAMHGPQCWTTTSHMSKVSLHSPTSNLASTVLCWGSCSDGCCYIALAGRPRDLRKHEPHSKTCLNIYISMLLGSNCVPCDVCRSGHTN